MSQGQQVSELQEAFISLWPYVRKAWAFALLGCLLVLAPTFYMSAVYGPVVNSRSHVTLVMFTLLLVLALAVMEALDWARAETMRAAGLWLDERLTPRVVDAVYGGALRRLGSVSLQALTDLRTLRDFLCQPALAGFMELPVAAVFLVILFALNPILGWSALAGAMVQVVISALNHRRTQPPLKEANRLAMEAQQYADASLRHAEVIEAMGMLGDVHRRWFTKQQAFLNSQIEASQAGGVFQAASKFVQLTLSSMLLGLGAWLLLENALWGGGAMLIVGSVLGGRVLAPLVQLVGQWRTVVNVLEAWSRLSDLLGQHPVAPPAMPLPAPKGHLAVEGVSAAFVGQSQSVLKNLNFALKPGEAMAVIGPSASGKTTLARLLVGLLPCQLGKVRLDGADVFNWQKSELGPHVGYLPQGAALLEGTLAENIGRFAEASRAQAEQAAKAVGLHDFILSLPQGYETPIGRGGAVFSGGQRQRVALARALCGTPALVVLDEPNSSLDEAGELALVEAIRAYKALGTTFVIMTHKTGILSVVDKMLVLQDGAQQAFGAREDVLKAMQEATAKARERAAMAPAALRGAGA